MARESSASGESDGRGLGEGNPFRPCTGLPSAEMGDSASPFPPSGSLCSDMPRWFIVVSASLLKGNVGRYLGK